MSQTIQNIDKLFSKPLPSSRSGAFYNTFPYPTKISPEAIAVYIASMTQPGETVLDAFSGSGSTGIAALLCEHPTENIKKTAKAFGVDPIWGKRNAVLYEIGTYASFATKTLTNHLKANEYAEAVENFIAKAEALVGEMYVAQSPEGVLGTLRYAIWTEVLVCPGCESELEYFQYGTSRNPATFRDTITCPHCNKTSLVADMAFAKEDYSDTLIGKTISRKKRKLAWVYGTSGNKNWDRATVPNDTELIRKIEDEFIPLNAPCEIEWGDLYRAGYHYGITHLHHFYTTRNYAVFSKLWHLTETYPAREKDALRLLLLSYNSAHCTLMTRVVAKKNSKDFILTGAQSGVLYVSKLPVEKNILLGLRRKAKPFEEVYRMLEDCHGRVEVKNCSSMKMHEADQSVDFVFTDPPFGDFIPYAEVNQINELWLQNVTERREEVIISNAQNKSLESYRDMLTNVFNEIRRVTQQNSPIAVVFHAAKASVWDIFSEAIAAAGLEIQQSSFLDKTQASFKQVVSKASVQGDPLFLLRDSKGRNNYAICDEQILKTVIAENPHKTEIERRHCYSLYVGKCMEAGVPVQKDASQIYEYIQMLTEGVK